MKSIFEQLKGQILITDGAMGTYYNSIAKAPLSHSEEENLRNPQVIKNIHTEYINSGAMLIRTNTFAANTEILKCDFKKIKEIISSGYNIAKEAVGDKAVYIGASIGPIPNSGNKKEYFDIVDTWLELGADIFVLETFSSTEYIFKIAEYIKSKNSNTFILAEFSLNNSGITKAGIAFKRLVEALCENNNIDALGFNCGVGPTHMEKILKELDYKSTKPFSTLPNAGYPDIINNKVEYINNPDYFADIVSKFVNNGVKIIGGCCGTTPQHIKKLCEAINETKIIPAKAKKFITDSTPVEKISTNSFFSKLQKQFVIAVELDPPFNTDIEKLISGTRLLKEAGVDIITIADSPMGKARADSVIISSHIKRAVGIDVLPHICCRDKNAIALHSVLLGAYIENIRNFLVVTGDPVPGENRESVKSVFNMNSYSLMGLIKQMNKDIFSTEPVHFGGAVNFNVKHKDNEYKRLLKKCEMGAEFFLTQPIFTDETIKYIKNIDKNREFKLLGGIMPPVTYRNVQFINNELPGITIPEEYATRFSPDMDRATAENIGVDIAVEIAQKIKPYVDGFYFMAPFNRCNMIKKILKKIN